MNSSPDPSMTSGGTATAEEMPLFSQPASNASRPRSGKRAQRSVQRAASIQERFEAFLRRNPRVYPLFKRFALVMLQANHRKYSARSIVHRMRWECDLDPDSQEQFKINDHYSSRLARKLMAEDERFEGFFELRELKDTEGTADGN